MLDSPIAVAVWGIFAIYALWRIGVAVAKRWKDAAKSLDERIDG